MNEQEQFWSGEGGTSYTARNRVDWRARIPFWHDIMKFTGARSVYEVGCNAGWNLSAIREAAGHHVGLHGCEPNWQAFQQASTAGLSVLPSALSVGDEIHASVYELVFTAGVLIHVSPENLPAMMRSVIESSTHYVLAIEYAAEQEEMIEYRGQPNLLWKRPYGKLYEDMGLKLLYTGEATGWDRATYWLLEKT